MINLLPQDYRRQLLAARSNTLLVRYIILMAIVIFVIIVELAGVYWFFNNSLANSQASIAENERRTASFQSTRQNAQLFSANLATAKQILDQQVSYVKIFTILSDSMPDGTIIERITVDPSQFGVPTTVDTRSKTYMKAIEFRQALNSTDVFVDTNFSSISLDAQDQSGYPYRSTYNVTFKKDAVR